MTRDQVRQMKANVPSYIPLAVMTKKFVVNNRGYSTADTPTLEAGEIVFIEEYEFNKSTVMLSVLRLKDGVMYVVGASNIQFQEYIPCKLMYKLLDQARGRLNS